MASTSNDANPPFNVAFEIPRSLSLSIIGLSRLSVYRSSHEFEAFEVKIFDEIRSRENLDDLKNDPILASYRELYWSFRMDPTKLRVSSEALLRRILKDENLWRISDIVDVVNLASPYHKLPIGLIDDAKRNGSLTVRTARKDEVFTRIGGNEILCRGREIVLADEEKIVCFGYATHDSDLSKVDSQSKDVLVVLYGSPAITTALLRSATETTQEFIQRWITCDVDGLWSFRSQTT